MTSGARTRRCDPASLFAFRMLDWMTPQVTAHETAPVAAPVAKILDAAQTRRTREELQNAAGIRHRWHFRAAYLRPLLQRGWIERTIPDKPTSRLQRYRTTEAGRRAIENGGT